MTEKKKTTKKATKTTAKKKAVAKEKHVETTPRIVREPKPGLGKVKYYGTGRRKEATAKVWLIPGSGKISVNGKTSDEYFCKRPLLDFKISRPFKVTNTVGKYDAIITALGGGVPGQADAVAMGISRALLEISPDFRLKLKRVGLLSRDSRMKERKKAGLKRARRAFQYTKR